MTYDAVNPQFKRLSDNQEIVREKIYRFVQGEADHIGCKKDQTAVFHLQNPESLKDDEKYQEFGRYKSSNNWVFIRMIKDPCNAYQFPHFRGFNPAGWGQGAVICLFNA